MRELNWIQQLNQSIDYIEENLAGEISYERLAQIAGCSVYNFQRMFSYIAGAPLSEYIRSRRLTQAAFDILGGGDRLLDLALKYGYESQEAFSRAFRAFHGVLPSRVRDRSASPGASGEENQPPLLKSCPKLSFQITAKGEIPMKYQIKQYPAFSVAGYSYTVRQADVFTEVPAIWERVFRDGTIGRVHELFQKTDYHPSGFLGVASGRESGAEEFHYLVGVTNFVEGMAPHVPALGDMQELQIPAATWAVFDASGPMPEAVQRVCRSFYTEWLPASGYRVADIPVLEAYQPEEHQEVWIAVEKA